MKRVRWTDNVCTVGGTCIHGYFTAEDLRWLFKLCPVGSFTPTFFHEKLPVAGLGLEDIDTIEIIGEAEAKLPGICRYPLHTYEHGYYFTFQESDGGELLEELKRNYPMVRGEGCY
jgi:hypothetical protein